MVVTARTTPTAAPTIVPVETPDGVCAGDGVEEEVDEGTGSTVEEGELPLRQPALSERATVSISEDPPELPRASVSVKIIVVPAATSATHVKLVPVAGGCRRKDSPPGMSPYM